MKGRSDLWVAAAGAIVGAVIAYWIGLRLGDAIVESSAADRETDLIRVLFDFIASLFVIVLVALIAAVIGTAVGVWAALRLGRHPGAGRTAAVALVLGTFVLLGGVPATIAVVEALGFGEDVVVWMAPLVPGLLGFFSRWLVGRDEDATEGAVTG